LQESDADGWSLWNWLTWEYRQYQLSRICRYAQFPVGALVQVEVVAVVEEMVLVLVEETPVMPLIFCYQRE